MQQENEKMYQENEKIHQDNEKLRQEMENQYHQSLINTVAILRGVGLSDEDIVGKLCRQYQLEETQAKEYL